MKFLLRILDKLRPNFEPGGKLAFFKSACMFNIEQPNRAEDISGSLTTPPAVGKTPAELVQLLQRCDKSCRCQKFRPAYYIRSYGS